MIREEDTRFKHLEKKIGAFAAVAILGIIAVLLLIGMEKEFFTAKYTLRFTVEKGTGFSRGMPVKLSGFRIGHIKTISLNEKAMVDIRIQIDKQYQKWIRNDSIARLVKEGLVGDNIIEISVGTPTAPLLKDGDTITYEKTKGLEEVANDIADKVKPVLIEVRDIISYINDPEGDIKQSLGNIRRLTGNLEGTRQHTDDLLITARTSIGTVAGTANLTMENANARISSLEPLVAKMDTSLSKIPPILEKVDATMVNVEKTTLELRKTAPRIQPLVSKTEDTMQSADTVLKALKETWPLKNHVPVPTDREFVPGDSHD
jgi:phospholipid/cholesterol/gamma-HCH transport system substrate-binding protein